MKYVKVILDLSFDKPLTYSVPVSLESKAKIGARCIVPVGKTRKHWGFIIALVKRPKFKTKNVIDIPDDIAVLSPVMLKFMKELSDYYFHRP